MRSAQCRGAAPGPQRRAREPQGAGPERRLAARRSTVPTSATPSSSGTRSAASTRRPARGLRCRRSVDTHQRRHRRGRRAKRCPPTRSTPKSPPVAGVVLQILVPEDGVADVGAVLPSSATRQAGGALPSRPLRPRLPRPLLRLLRLPRPPLRWRTPPRWLPRRLRRAPRSCCLRWVRAPRVDS